MLHITNGDSAAGSLSQSRISGHVLSWRDVLHEGPVPAGLDLKALSLVRARFIAGEGWAAESTAPVMFEERDSLLRRAEAREDVVLWFEADLYDQLQLIQLLDWFSEHPPRSLSLICIADHPAVRRFVGLGQLSPAQMADLFPTRQAVSAEQLSLGHEAWEAFRAPTPFPLADLLARDTAPLPFLAAALLRLLDEYPSVETGLGRTESQVLRALSQGAETFPAVFVASQDMESRPFMGDTTLWARIGMLATGPAPAVRFGTHVGVPKSGLPWQGIPLELTRFGQAYLEGTADLVRDHGIDRWIGGVHLSGYQVPWRWDRENNRLISR
jgi:hypothetical protein